MEKKLVTGLFPNTIAAEQAVTQVTSLGHTTDDISVLASARSKYHELAIEGGTRAGHGAGVGATVGGTAVAVIGALLAVGTSVLLPGFGLVVAGPLAGAIAGAGAGGAAGTLIGALVGVGIPEHRAKVYESGLREGGILVGVEAYDTSDAQRIEKAFADCGARTIRRE